MSDTHELMAFGHAAESAEHTKVSDSGDQAVLHECAPFAWRRIKELQKLLGDVQAMLDHEGQPREAADLIGDYFARKGSV